MVCNHSGGSCRFIPKVDNQFKTRHLVMYWAVELIIVIFTLDLVGLLLFVRFQNTFQTSETNWYHGLVFFWFDISFLVFIEEGTKVNSSFTANVDETCAALVVKSYLEFTLSLLNGPPCKRHFRGLFNINFASKNSWRKFYDPYWREMF